MVACHVTEKTQKPKQKSRKISEKSEKQNTKPSGAQKWQILLAFYLLEKYKKKERNKA